MNNGIGKSSFASVAPVDIRMAILCIHGLGALIRMAKIKRYINNVSKATAYGGEQQGH